jgi:transposase-like protein
MPTSSRSPFNRPRWTEQDARAVLAALEQSGQSVRVFAEAHGLDPQRLYEWRRRVAGGDRTTFRELVVRASSSRAESPFEIALASGVVVRVPSSFDEGALARLLSVVSRAC